MGAPTPLVLLPLWCSYPLGCSYPLVLLRWVLLPLGCSYPIGCSYPLRFVFVLVDVSLLMGGINVRSGLTERRADVTDLGTLRGTQQR